MHTHLLRLRHHPEQRNTGHGRQRRPDGSAVCPWRPVRQHRTVNIGTGAFVLLPTDDPSTRPAGLLAGISYSDAHFGSYYIEGTVNGAAAALEWAAGLFAFSDLEQQLPGWLETVKAPTLFMNTLGGLGSPWWQEGPAPHFLDTGYQARRPWSRSSRASCSWCRPISRCCKPSIRRRQDPDQRRAVQP